MGLFRQKRNTKTIAERNPLRVLRDGDSLCCWGGKKDTLTDDITAVAGGGPWYHTAMFFWKRHDPFVIEMDRPEGREVPWVEWLQRREDQVDVFRVGVGHGYSREKAVRWMQENILGKPYGLLTIARFVRENNWLTGLFYRACADEDAPPPPDWVCSTSMAGADKYGGGVHPVRRLWIGDTNPTAYTRSFLRVYLFTVSGTAVKGGH